MPRIAIALIAAVALAGCTSAPRPGAASPPPMRSAPPPMASPTPQPAPSTGGFIAPRIMQVPGLEAVIGKNATALANTFGAPRLEVREGDALKLQFRDEACVLDVYLYPLEPGGEPNATYVDARRSSDGLDVDRAACVAALRR